MRQRRRSFQVSEVSKNSNSKKPKSIQSITLFGFCSQVTLFVHNCKHTFVLLAVYTLICYTEKVPKITAEKMLL